MASLTQNARDTLQADFEIPVVSLEDVYGGKLVAAMDRQHPRDLFDVMQLFAHEGITAGIRRAFAVYLASYNRPVHEVLFPSPGDIRQEFEHNFAGMTATPSSSMRSWRPASAWCANCSKEWARWRPRLHKRVRVANQEDPYDQRDTARNRLQGESEARL